MKKIRVWVTCYNEERNIERCLQSIEGQIVHGADIELLISTNHSTDESAQLIDTWARTRHYAYMIPIDRVEPGDTKVAGIEHMAFMQEELNKREQDYTIHLGGHDYWKNSGVLDRLFQRAAHSPRPPAITYPKVWQVDARGEICGHYGDHFQTNGTVTALLAQQVIQSVSSPQFFGLWDDGVRRAVPVRHLCSGFDHLIVAAAALHGAILYEPSACLVMQAPLPGSDLLEYGKKHLTPATLKAGPQDYLNQLEWCLHLVDEAAKAVPEQARPFHTVILKASMVATYLSLRGMNLHIVPGAMETFFRDHRVGAILEALNSVNLHAHELIAFTPAKGVDHG